MSATVVSSSPRGAATKGSDDKPSSSVSKPSKEGGRGSDVPQQRGGSSPTNASSASTHEPDLFSVLSAMHLSNPPQTQGAAQSIPTRKRKFLEQQEKSGKLNGRMMRRGSNEDYGGEVALHTPQCSQSGYADEEDKQHQLDHGSTTAQGKMQPPSQPGGPHQHHHHHHSHHHGDHTEIDLAANFDDSLSGLGVDINTSNYSMSEALLALPNLSISNSQVFRTDNRMSLTHPESPTGFKDEPYSAPNSNSNSNSKNYNLGVLDLSNDEAHLPDSNGTEDSAITGPKTFTGSVHREFSRDSLTLEEASLSMNASNNGYEKEGRKTKKKILPVPAPPAVASEPTKKDIQVTKIKSLNELTAEGERFQYILYASTSLATKINEPTITYLNQSQSYELRLKKLGDLSNYRKKYLRCTMRICFHERRLRYMEQEQIAEWKLAHPGERILYADVPLSYGIFDVVQDPAQLNVVSFRWDPTRDTGIFLKVNCISTEFTPKKHGGEKGVPFRLQVETFDSAPSGDDIRLHAAGCVLQVFKLKGADRKHKQDRDKISRRPPAEQEKFAPSLEVTVLSDLSVENIYIPPTSRPISPPDLGIKMGPPDSNSGLNNVVHKTSSCTSITSPSEKDIGASNCSSPTSGKDVILNTSSSVDAVAFWLAQNRYNPLVETFRNYNGRDLMRLQRDELIAMCGMSEGIRLYNDLHVAPVAPRATFFIAQKQEDHSPSPHEYNALFLEECTVREFLTRLAEVLSVNPAIFNRVLIYGPQHILMRVTDTVIQYTKPDSVFHFSLRQLEHNSHSFDIILENVTHMIQVGGGSGHQDSYDQGLGTPGMGSEFHPSPSDEHLQSQNGTQRNKSE